MFVTSQNHVVLNFKFLFQKKKKSVHVSVYDVWSVNMADIFFSSIHVIHFFGGGLKDLF